MSGVFSWWSRGLGILGRNTIQMMCVFSSALHQGSRDGDVSLLLMATLAIWSWWGPHVSPLWGALFVPLQFVITLESNVEAICNAVFFQTSFSLTLKSVDIMYDNRNVLEAILYFLHSFYVYSSEFFCKELLFLPPPTYFSSNWFISARSSYLFYLVGDNP